MPSQHPQSTCTASLLVYKYFSLIVLTVNTTAAVSLPGITTLHCINICQCSHLSFQHLSMIFMTCSNNFTLLQASLFFTPPFFLRTGTDTIVWNSYWHRHNSLELIQHYFPYNTCWKTFVFASISISPLANIISAHTSEGPVSFPL